MKRFHETDETNSFLLNIEELKSPVRKMDSSKLGPIPRFDPFFSLFLKIFQHVDHSNRSKIPCWWRIRENWSGLETPSRRLKEEMTVDQEWRDSSYPRGCRFVHTTRINLTNDSVNIQT